MRRRFRPYQVPTHEEIAPYLRETPVRIRDLILDAGMILEEAELEEGGSSTVEATEGRFRITLNANDTEIRRRFAAAYTLARILLNRFEVMDAGGPLASKLFVPAESFKTAPKGEAQQLGIALLVPPNPLRETHKAGASLGEMAGLFLTSQKVIQNRLRTLSLDPPPELVSPGSASGTVTSPMGAEPQV
jgi:hypothetical protein